MKKRWALGLLLVLLLTSCRGEEEPSLGPEVKGAPVIFQGKEVPFSQVVEKEGLTLTVLWQKGCGPCESQLPVLQGIQDSLRDRGISLLALGFGEEEDLKEELASLAPEVPLVLGTEAFLQGVQPEITATPAMFLAGPDGVPRGRIHRGYHGESEEELLKIIEKMK